MEFVSEPSLNQILSLVGSTNLGMVRVALEVLDSLVYYSKEECTKALLSMNILDVLEQQLVREDRVPVGDHEQRLRLTKICYLICNLMSTKDGKLRRMVKGHSILDKVYQG